IATVRASLYIYNTEKDIDILVEAIEKARNFFNHGN
ncbi:MAG: aminotransferase, partial [Lactobacillus iners]|nr:aminotransferase [Lactobacillus iners]